MTVDLVLVSMRNELAILYSLGWHTTAKLPKTTKTVNLPDVGLFYKIEIVFI